MKLEGDSDRTAMLARSTTIPFGTEVKADFSKIIPATVNGFTGGWVTVSYKGIDGYAWSQYLADITIPRQENINNDFRVIAGRCLLRRTELYAGFNTGMGSLKRTNRVSGS